MDVYVADIMTPDLITLNETDSLERADDLMQVVRIRHLPVVNDGQLIGLVTHRDVLRAQVSSLADLSEEEARKLNSTIPVSSVMTKDLLSISPTERAVVAAKILYTQKIGCLPVVDGEELVGLVTESDFMKLVIKALEQEALLGD